MKNKRRFKLLLTPILISVLSFLMIVTTFSWYKVAVGDVDLTATDHVSLTVAVPIGLDVQITTLGDKCDSSYIVDNYYYNPTTQEYVITKDKTVGYFGQTGTGSLDLNDDDKPYIAFYKADLTTNDPAGVKVNSAIIQKAVITKDKKTMYDSTLDSITQGNQGLYTAETSEFSIDFYSMNMVGNELFFSNPSATFTIPTSTTGDTKGTLYFGIKFFKRNSPNAFRFSPIDYMGSSFKLEIAFK